MDVGELCTVLFAQDGSFRKSDRALDQTCLVDDIHTGLHLTISLNEVITVDELGPAAVIRSGQLAQVYGVPFLVSGAVGVADTDG